MPSPHGFVRRHLRPLVGGAIAAGILSAGGIAYAASATTASSSATTAAASSTASAATSTKAHPARRARLRAARGTVTAIKGSTWTIRTRRGVTLTVTVSSRTKFGTKTDPESASSFRVGSTVALVGRRTGAHEVTARHIWTPKARTGSSTSAAATTPAA